MNWESQRRRELERLRAERHRRDAAAAQRDNDREAARRSVNGPVPSGTRDARTGDYIRRPVPVRGAGGGGGSRGGGGCGLLLLGAVGVAARWKGLA